MGLLHAHFYEIESSGESKEIRKIMNGGSNLNKKHGFEMKYLGHLNCRAVSFLSGGLPVSNI